MYRNNLLPPLGKSNEEATPINLKDLTTSLHP